MNITFIFFTRIALSKEPGQMFNCTGLNGPQKDQVGWRGYLTPKSGSPASILGSPAIYSKKAKRFFFPLSMLVMVIMLFSSNL